MSILDRAALSYGRWASWADFRQVVKATVAPHCEVTGNCTGHFWLHEFLYATGALGLCPPEEESISVLGVTGSLVAEGFQGGQMSGHQVNHMLVTGETTVATDIDPQAVNE